MQFESFWYETKTSRQHQHYWQHCRGGGGDVGGVLTAEPFVHRCPIYHTLSLPVTHYSFCKSWTVESFSHILQVPIGVVLSHNLIVSVWCKISSQEWIPTKCVFFVDGPWPSEPGLHRHPRPTAPHHCRLLAGGFTLSITQIMPELSLVCHFNGVWGHLWFSVWRKWLVILNQPVHMYTCKNHIFTQAIIMYDCVKCSSSYFYDCSELHNL